MTMRDCADGTVRDLLPEFVRGTLSAREFDRVEAHVLACQDCAAEAELLRAIGSAHPVPDVDMDRIVAAIRPPLRVGSFRAARWRAAAAVVVVVLGAASVAVLGGTFRLGSAGNGMFDSTASGVNDSTAPAVLLVDGGSARSAPAGAAGETGFGFGGGLADLTEEQLTTLLGEVESLDASPSAEPDVHAISIETTGEGGTNDW